jgi:hypothetical protein
MLFGNTKKVTCRWHRASKGRKTGLFDWNYEVENYGIREDSFTAN